ncbi:histidine phosphatase family protein [Candidatus Roizmanbacteria bacterium]|nr:histidine phosphatase family protein [Candidatus Roizmanbacteria bacterium]
MRLYLVRHGESEGNAVDVHQFVHTPLSKAGIRQAKQLACRFESIEIDTIFASDFTRTLQTAHEIASITKKEIITTPFLREVRRPTEILGKNVNKPEVLAIKQKIKEHFEDPQWHYADEENFFDMKHRVSQFLPFLESRSEKHILAVTHGVTMRMILGLIILGNNLKPKEFIQLAETLSVNNTGITVFEKKDEHPWRLLTWNDHAHLG